MKGLAVQEKGRSVGDKIEARLRRAQPAGCLPRLENTHTSTHQPPETEGFRPQLRPSWFRAHMASLAWATPPPFQAVILPEVLMLRARPGRVFHCPLPACPASPLGLPNLGLGRFTVVLLWQPHWGDVAGCDGEEGVLVLA